MRTNLHIFLCILVATGINATLSNNNGGEKLSVYEGESYWIVEGAYQFPFLLNTFDLNNLIDPSVEKLVFIVHGWLGSRFVDWYAPLTNNILMQYPTWRVIQVDWSFAASSSDYYVSAENSVFVGQNIGDFINQIILQGRNITADKILLIGHSLGAHAVGFAGKRAKDYGNIVSRIVGLDPAFPPWNELPCDQRLCKTDAQYLTVIHTDTGTNGMIIPIGNADFYPGNGTNQPGCDLIPAMLHMCNHERSVLYFTEGVQYPDHFTSTRCSDYETYMTNQSLCDGLTVHMADLFTNVEGVFYLNTNSAPPYSIN